MGELYDYNTGRFRGEFRGIQVDLNIRTPITQVCGASGTGKSFLIQLINSEYMDSCNFSRTNELNVIAFDRSNAKDLTIETLSNIKQRLIVIDRGDLLLSGNDNLVEFIAMDRNNHYLIFSRVALALGLSPNYYGEFSIRDREITISYHFSEEAWF